jgi:hypothetical protein
MQLQGRWWCFLQVFVITLSSCAGYVVLLPMIMMS